MNYRGRKYQDDDMDGHGSRNLLARFTFVAILIPVCTAFFLWLYFSFTNQELTRADGKTLVFCVWLGTLFVLGITAFQAVWGRRRFRRDWHNEDDKGAGGRAQTLRDTAQKWETRSTKRLLSRLLSVFIIVPALAYGLTLAYFFLIGRHLSPAEWKTITICIWLGAVLCLCRVGRREGRAKLVYESEKTTDPQEH